jgi:hypothetical protein
MMFIYTGHHTPFVLWTVNSEISNENDFFAYIHTILHERLITTDCLFSFEILLK